MPGTVRILLLFILFTVLEDVVLKANAQLTVLAAGAGRIAVIPYVPLKIGGYEGRRKT
jgi:hypothetical protein